MGDYALLSGLFFNKDSDPKSQKKIKMPQTPQQTRDSRV